MYVWLGDLLMAYADMRGGGPPRRQCASGRHEHAGRIRPPAAEVGGPRLAVPVAERRKGAYVQRSCLTERWAVAGPGPEPGEVLLPWSVRHPVRGLVECRGAELLGGTLRRSGLAVRYLPGEVVRLEQMPERDPQVAARVVSFLGRDGRAVGLAAVTGTGRDAVTAAEALARWTGVLRTRRLVSGGGNPLCAGARREELVLEQVRREADREVVVLGAARPRSASAPSAAGVVFAAGVDEVPPGALVVIGAAGVGLSARDRLAERGVPVVDAVCLLVAAVQAEVRRLAGLAGNVVLVGRRADAVVPGLVGQAPGAVLLVEDAAGAAEVAVRDPRRVAVVVQPGLVVEAGARVAEAVRDRFGQVLPQDPATYCYAASDRRHALARLARTCDVVLLVGEVDAAPDSARVVAAAGGTAYAVPGPEGVRPEWLAGSASIAVAAVSGAGVPETARVLQALTGLGPSALVVQEHVTVDSPAAPGTPWEPVPAGGLPGQGVGLAMDRTRLRSSTVLAAETPR